MHNIATRHIPYFHVVGEQTEAEFEFKPGNKYQATLTDAEYLMLGMRKSEIGRPIEIIYNDEADNDYFDTPYQTKTDGKVLKKNTIINIRRSDRINQRVQLKLKRY